MDTQGVAKVAHFFLHPVDAFLICLLKKNSNTSMNLADAPGSVHQLCLGGGAFFHGVGSGFDLLPESFQWLAKRVFHKFWLTHTELLAEFSELHFLVQAFIEIICLIEDTLGSFHRSRMAE